MFVVLFWDYIHAGQLKMLNKTNAENGHRVFSIFKKKQGNNGVGFLFSRGFFSWISKIQMSIFEICLILYFMKLCARRGFWKMLAYAMLCQLGYAVSSKLNLFQRNLKCKYVITILVFCALTFVS